MVNLCLYLKCIPRFFVKLNMIFISPKVNQHYNTIKDIALKFLPKDGTVVVYLVLKKISAISNFDMVKIKCLSM